MICLKIARAGYYGGSPAAVRSACVTDVLDIFEYEHFLGVYDFTETKLNEK